MGGCGCIGRCHWCGDGDIGDGEAVYVRWRVQSVDTMKREYEFFSWLFGIHLGGVSLLAARVQCRHYKCGGSSTSNCIATQREEKPAKNLIVAIRLPLKANRGGTAERP